MTNMTLLLQKQYILACLFLRDRELSRGGDPSSGLVCKRLHNLTSRSCEYSFLFFDTGRKFQVRIEGWSSNRRDHGLKRFCSDKTYFSIWFIPCLNLGLYYVYFLCISERFKKKKNLESVGLITSTKVHVSSVVLILKVSYIKILGNNG